MILELKNFKCYLKAKFVLSDEHLFFTAPSGYGKTTILDAIRFVLWGSKENLCSFGKKSCEVLLTYKGYIFKRKKGPNYFEIKKEDSGEIIDNPEDFITIYFPKYPTDFISMTSVKQMEFLENLSVGSFSTGGGVDKLKDNIKSLISEGKRYIDTQQSEIRMNEKLMENLPGTYVQDLPVIDYNIDHRIHSLKIKCDEIIMNEKLLENYRKELQRITLPLLDEEEYALGKKIIKLRTLKERIKFLEEKLFNLQKNCNFPDETVSLNWIEIDQKIEDLNILYHEQKKSDETLNKLWRNVKKYSCTKDLAILSQYLEKERLEEEKNSPYKDMKKYACPKCSEKLIFNENSQKLQSLPKYDNGDLALLEDISCFLRQKTFGTDKDLKSIQQEITQYRKIKECRELEQELTQMKSQQENHDNLPVLEEQQKKLEQKKMLEEKIQKLSSKNVFNSTQCLKDISEEIDFLESYKENRKIKILHDETELLKNKVELAVNRYEQLIHLKNIVEECQSVSLKSLISVINKEVKYFTDRFFDNDGISVVFSEYKEVISSKSVKPQITMTINYNNFSSVKVSTLSSGEMARIKLAVDLVLYKLSNTAAPLLLDEVTVNLDGELSSRIFGIIQQYFSDKCVFMIAHQVVEGIFDNIINAQFLAENSQKNIS